MEPLHKNRGLAHSHLFKFLLLELICLMLMVADKNRAIAQPIRDGLSYLALPLIKMVEWPQSIYQVTELALSRQQLLIEENTQLKQQLIEAQLKVQQNTTLVAENHRLRELLGARQESPLSTSVAFVSNINLNERRHHIIINQGSSDGVFVGQAVIGLTGVIGQVDVVSAQSSHVILLTDAAHGHQDTLLLNEIPISADIQSGDVLVTSGFGNRFPRGLKIAEVTSLSLTENRMFQTAEADPYVNFERLTEVFLVWPEQATVTTGVDHE